jgi:hypothetical protein
LSVVDNPAMKWFLNILIARSVVLPQCIPAQYHWLTWILWGWSMLHYLIFGVLVNILFELTVGGVMVGWEHTFVWKLARLVGMWTIHSLCNDLLFWQW